MIQLLYCKNCLIATLHNNNNNNYYYYYYFVFIIDRSFVNDQMDPNNISGLLKLHLRENPILSSALISEVQDEMNPSSPNEIVC